jgi:hypothetical protein
MPLGWQTLSIMLCLYQCAYCESYLSMISGVYRSSTLSSYYFKSIFYLISFRIFILEILFKYNLYQFSWE